MKKCIAILAVALAGVSAFAQEVPDTVSTVVGNKMNFEAPLFGVKNRDEIKTWTLITLDDVSIGANYLIDSPAGMKSWGYFATTPFLGIRYRPWRDGNLFSASAYLFVAENFLDKGLAFSDGREIMAKPEEWIKAMNSYRMDFSTNMQIGYTKELRDFKAGIYVIPGIGWTNYTNRYRLKEHPDIVRNDNLTINEPFFRTSFKVGVWYNDAGITIEYEPIIGSRTSPVPKYAALRIGLSCKY